MSSVPDQPTPTPSPTSRHRRRRAGRRRTTALVGTVVSVAVIGVLVASASSGERSGSKAGRAACPTGNRPLQVVAAPEIAAVVAAAGQAVSAGGTCAQFTVTPRAAAEVASELAPGRVRPDVWLPDSSIWIRRPEIGTARWASIATSPVVVALSTAQARRAGWPGRPLSFSDVLRSARLGLGNPTQSAPTVGVMAAVLATLKDQPNAPAALATAVRRARTGLPGEPGRAMAVLADPDPVAVAVSEQAVWAHNVQARHTRAVAGYLPAGGMTLDYPFLTLTSVAPARAQANRLLESLQHGIGRDRLLAQGFRTGTDGPGPALRADLGVDPTHSAAVTVPRAAAVTSAARALRAVTLPSRLLAVIDVSGSMGTSVPGAGPATRLDLVSAAVARGLGLYADQAEIGLWAFSTDLAPGTDYRQLVPIGPLGTRPDGVTGRERLVGALGALRGTPGDTGLYDTTLAAVRDVRRGWNPGRANSVLLLTDGRNDDDSGIGLEQLLGTLRLEAGSGRPVPVNTIGYGTGSDAKALAAISAATGGRQYSASDTRQIDRIFLDAIGRRACSPTC